MSQQSIAGNALINDMGRHWSLSERFTFLANPLATDMALYLSLALDIVQLFRHILANVFQRTAAVALQIFRLVVNLYARQLWWQGTALGSGRCFSFWGRLLMSSSSLMATSLRVSACFCCVTTCS